MSLRQWRNLSAAIALLPIVLEWIWKTVIHPQPWWLHYYDPETSYFYEGLRIASGQSPFNVDNPATPLQLFSAAFSLMLGPSPLTYPRFIVAVHVFGLLLTIAGAFLLVHTLLRDAPPMLAVTAIWTWFMAPQALEYQLVWCGEILFFGFGAVALASVAGSLTNPIDRRRDLLAGATIGLLISVKFVFVAWIAALCIAYFAARERPIYRSAVATGSAVAAFFTATAVAWPRYPAMAHWLARLAFNSGYYGNGRRALPRLSDVISNYARVVLTSKGWMVWLAVVVICAVATWLRGPRLARPVIVFAAAASGAVVVMAMRSPAFRYLFPVALCAVLVFAVSAPLLKTRRRETAALALFAALLLGKAIAGDMRDHTSRIESLLPLHDKVTATVAGLAPNGVVVYGWRFPTPSFGLRINATNYAQLGEIERRYPREGHYNDWFRRVLLPAGATHWDVLVIDRAMLSGFAQPVGRTAGHFNQYDVILAPGR
jgi:hypothetical protein